ncbi:MAG: hypothetical protein GEV28_05435 [Actinophytocola sp.]|uniref:hypothetical protein n=1 Tax=Actinophytocola sp. TaxID=1872138 RepID=UPI00132A106C|nr:hypothetical protein [Actinophytocola sp.]MPZ79857.1 hypothetical protein [Actinophytocola sp.]
MVQQRLRRGRAQAPGKATRTGPRRDDNLAHELDGMLRANRPNRAEEWRESEMPADDEPAPWEEPRQD